MIADASSGANDGLFLIVEISTRGRWGLVGARLPRGEWGKVDEVTSGVKAGFWWAGENRRGERVYMLQRLKMHSFVLHFR